MLVVIQRSLVLAVWVTSTSLALGCAAAPARPAQTAAAPRAPADQLATRTPDQIAGAPALAPKPLHPVPVPLDSAVAGTPPPSR